MVTATTREENGEFCIAVAPATRTYTAGILMQLVKGAGHLADLGHYTGLIRFNLRRLKWDALPRNEPMRNLPGSTRHHCYEANAR